MKIAVLGAGGMLGREVVKVLGDEAVPLYHVQCDVTSFSSLRRCLSEVDAAINCAGIIPSHSKSNEEMIQVNSLAPQILTNVFNGHIVNVSTDCVFNGDRGNYSIYDAPDSYDIYGKSKALGEVEAKHVTNVRTSFIGFQHGLLRWLLENEYTANGYVNSIWSGSTVEAVATALCMLAKGNPKGLVHLATKPISKYEVLCYVKDLLDLDIIITRCETPIINRSLVATIPLKPVTECKDFFLKGYERYLQCK